MDQQMATPIALSAILLLFLSAISVAQSPRPKTSPWKHYSFTPQGDPNHSGSYILDTTGPYPCTVWINRDNSLTVVAIDPNYDDPRDHTTWELWETINIKGGTKVITYGEARAVSDRWGNIKGYDVFEKNYIGAAKELPREIRQLFKGAYGIGSKL